MISPLLSAFGSALTNARQAAGELAHSVHERSVLTTSLDEAPTPGRLIRLTSDAAFALLGTRSVGRLAYVARADRPEIVLVNYRAVGATVYVSSGPGPKLQAADRRAQVAFEVDVIDDETRTGWSVVAYGTARRLALDERTALVQAGGAPEPWALGPRHDVIAIDITRISGRELP